MPGTNSILRKVLTVFLLAFDTYPPGTYREGVCHLVPDPSLKGHSMLFSGTFMELLLDDAWLIFFRFLFMVLTIVYII